MSAEDDFVHDICEAFELSEASWHAADTGNPGDGILFYLSALRILDEKPLPESWMQVKVRQFLIKKLEVASDRRFDDLTDRLKNVYQKHEEIV